jgi:predicted unusual protein kinase regulating ubiquinone biosynthesis (AarF/ABC1/UbiB family)
MFTYVKKIYNQFKNLYDIKKHIDTIYRIKDINNEEENNKLFKLLKDIIFQSGSLYIKFLQWYISKLKSNIINNDNPDTIITIKFINYFEDIFEQCPYHSLEHTKTIFKEVMYGIELEDYIDISTFKTIASGSIGQVYYGKRKRDGVEVAIKVKHPTIDTDLENQYELLTVLRYIQSIHYFKFKYNLIFNIDDFLEDINLQCNFNNEANNVKKFIENFKESSNYIIFPKILFQSNDLLISEYIEGKSIESLSDMAKFKTSLNFICFFKQMLFIDNFIHGDLHCKNWKVNYNENTKITQMIIYDCGICFENSNIKLSTDFWFALINYDIDKLIIVLKEFLKINNDLNIPYFTLNKFDEDVTYIFKNIIDDNNHMGTSLIMNILLDIFRNNNLIIHKFLLNFTIFICVIEDYMKSNNLISKTINNNVTMFDVINDSHFDIIAFCETNKCYTQVCDLIKLKSKDNFKVYKNNNKINNFENNEKKKLFSSIELSSLTFKPPE